MSYFIKDFDVQKLAKDVNEHMRIASGETNILEDNIRLSERNYYSDERVKELMTEFYEVFHEPSKIEIAKKIGIHTNTLYSWSAGTLEVSEKTLIKMGRFFDKELFKYKVGEQHAIQAVKEFEEVKQGAIHLNQKFYGAYLEALKNEVRK